MPKDNKHRPHDKGKDKVSILEDLLAQDPGRQIVFVGSLNCLRHKSTSGIGKLMQQGRAAILCPTMTDFSTGRYINQLEQAIVELAEERNTTHFTVMFGCQWVILSTDAELLASTLASDHGIELDFHDASNLEKGNKPKGGHR